MSSTITNKSSNSGNSIAHSAIILGTGILIGVGLRSLRKYIGKTPPKLLSTSTMEPKNNHVIYKVNVSVQKEADNAFRLWLPNHAKELLKLPGFIEAEWFVNSTPSKPTVVFVLGGPGAGKGTQCERIVHEFGFEHISAGDCLRAERNSDSEDAHLINQYIKEGKIVPVEITVKLLQKAMSKSGKSKFLIDGFPRNANNVEGWKRVVGNSANIAFVLFLDCTEKVMESRLLERGKTSGRVDDNVESIRKRFRTYQEETRPIIEMFSAEGKVRHVSSVDSIDTVWNTVKKVFQDLEEESSNDIRQFVIQYRLQNQQALDRYLTEFAPAMRVSGMKEFGNKIQISREYLKSLEKFY